MKKCVLMMFAATFLVSCAKSELNQPGGVYPQGVDIQLTGVHKAVEVDATRAPYMGQISNENRLTARVLASTVDGDFSAGKLHANGQMVFKGGTSISSYERNSVTEEQAKFPGEGSTPLFLCGLYPYENWNTPDKKAVLVFTGREDVMAAAQLSTTPDESLQTAPSLTFRHLLTKLEISLKGSSSAASGKWGKVTGIKLLKVNDATPNNEVTVTLKNAQAAFGANAASSIGLYGMSKENDLPTYSNTIFAGQELTEELTPCAYTMIAPFASGTAKDLTFEITTQYSTLAATVDVKLPAFSSTAGRAFDVKFTFNLEEGTIIGSASVIDWVFSGEGGATLD